MIGPLLVGFVLFATGCSDAGSPTASTSSSGSDDTSSTTSAGDGTGSDDSVASRPPIPKVGDCLEPMTGPLAGGTRLPELTPCGGPHGGEVISISEVSGGADAPYPATTGRIVGADAQVDECTGDATKSGRFGEFAGDNRLDVPAEASSATGVTEAWSVSGVSPAVYVPGPAAWARGERWLACAAVLDHSVDAPASYEGSLRDARSKRGELEAALAWCKLQPDPAAPQDFQSVSCNSPHNYEQLASFAAGTADADFPGDDVLGGLGDQLCAPLAADATNGRVTTAGKEYALSWSYPQQDDWSRGERIVRCYTASLSGLTVGTVGSGTAKPAK